MTYPGTKIREQTALESGLIQRVTELEKERDELVDMLRESAWCAKLFDVDLYAEIETALAKYPK